MNKNIITPLLWYGIPLILLLFIPLANPGPYIIHILILTIINIVLASSLRLINLSGQLSLAHGGMMSIGAYTSALLVMKLGMSTWLALVLAGIFAALIAFLIGFPFTRLKGIYFAMVTIFFVEIVTLIIQQWRELTNGSNGIFNIPRPDAINIPGIINITFASKENFYYLLIVIMVISLAVIYAIMRSRIGLIFRGIQQAHSLSESIGINTTSYKIMAFSIGSFFPGILGGFYSQYISAIDPTTFGFLFTIYVLIYMIVGGTENFAGPIIGAIILTLLPEVARPLKAFMPFIFAAVLMLIIFFMPEGLIGLPQRFKNIRFRLPNRAE